MKKTNLGIERTGTHGDSRGDWRVYGKLTGKGYSRGTRYDCTWQISNHPGWYREEEEEANRDRDEQDAWKAYRENEVREY